MTSETQTILNKLALEECRQWITWLPKNMNSGVIMIYVASHFRSRVVMKNMSLKLMLTLRYGGCSAKMLLRIALICWTSLAIEEQVPRISTTSASGFLIEVFLVLAEEVDGWEDCWVDCVDGAFIWSRACTRQGSQTQPTISTIERKHSADSASKDKQPSWKLFS